MTALPPSLTRNCLWDTAGHSARAFIAAGMAEVDRSVSVASPSSSPGFYIALAVAQTFDLCLSRMAFDLSQYAGRPLVHHTKKVGIVIRNLPRARRTVDGARDA